MWERGEEARANAARGRSSAQVAGPGGILQQEKVGGFPPVTARQVFQPTFRTPRTPPRAPASSSPSSPTKEQRWLLLLSIGWTELCRVEQLYPKHSVIDRLRARYAVEDRTGRWQRDHFCVGPEESPPSSRLSSAAGHRPPQALQVLQVHSAHSAHPPLQPLRLPPAACLSCGEAPGQEGRTRALVEQEVVSVQCSAVES
jgi:hypothetical protein